MKKNQKVQRYGRFTAFIGLVAFLCAGSVSFCHALQVSPTYHIFSLKPGEKVTGELILTNTDERDMLIFPSVKDWVAYPDNKDIKTASWLQVLNSTFSLRKGESQQIKFTAEAPERAKGEVMGMLTFVTASDLGSSVQFHLSVAVYVGIKGTENYDADISTLTIANSSDSLKAHFLLTNIGNVHIRPHGYIKVFDMAGQPLANIETTDRNPTHPGGSRTYGGQIRQFNLKPGKYKALVTLTDMDRQLEITTEPRAFVMDQKGDVKWR